MQKNRTKLNVTLLSLAALSACKPGEVKKPINQDQPNIIWIYADDHDAKAISALGQSLIETPNIDRIANQGMIFENSFVTNSICAPCRAVLLTGKYSHMNGVLGNKTPIDSTQQNFAKILQKNGYQTALVGKWHLHSTPSGFDYYNMLPGHGQYYDPDFIENGQRKNHEGYVTDLTTDFALEYIKNIRDKNKPFCLLLHNKAPHSPWLPAPRHLKYYRNDTIPVPESYFFDCKRRGKPACEAEMKVYGHFSDKATLCKMYDKKGDSIITDKWLAWQYGQLDPREQLMFDTTYLEENRQFNTTNLTEEEKAIWYYQRYMKDYLRCIMAIDENVGRLLDYLEESGLAENTVVMYSSDQGFYLGEFGWYDKRFMYEKSMRTPLIVKWPGVTKPGSRNEHLVQNVDMAETFLDMAGVTPPDDMQGQSIVPLLKGQDDQWQRDALYYHYYEFPQPHHVYPHYGVRTRNEKLIHFYTIDKWEYYNLDKDPKEMNNLFENGEFQENIKRLKTKIAELQIQYGDTAFLD